MWNSFLKNVNGSYCLHRSLNAVAGNTVWWLMITDPGVRLSGFQSWVSCFVGIEGSVPNPCNKVSFMIKHGIVFLLVEGFAFNLLKKNK